MRSKTLALAIVGVAVAGIAVSAGSEDVIRFTRVMPAHRVTVLLDGVKASGCVDDEVHTAMPPASLKADIDVPVGNMLPLPAIPLPKACNSEVVTFARDYALDIRAGIPAWTANDTDVLSVKLRPKIEVPVTIRVLMGTTAAERLLFSQQATDDLHQASLLYNGMAGGISFKVSGVKDVSTVIGAQNLLLSSCGNAASFKALGFTSGQLNAYYIDQVGGSARGKWCGAEAGEPNVILIGATTADRESLAHEIGHAFSLSHSNDIDSSGQLVPLPGIPLSNLMLTGVTNRSTITNGQLFRVNVNSASMLNKNGNRTGTVRTCPNVDADTKCPALSLDLLPK